MRRAAILALPAAALLAASAARAQSNQLPEPLGEVAFEQRLGEALPLDARFLDESGVSRQLGDLLGERPAVLVLAYYHCPMLCGLVLEGLARSLKAVDLFPGRDFEVVVASFDPTETSTSAAARKRETLERYGRPETEAGWHFLTGEEEAIRALTASVGFRYAAVEEAREFAHAAGIIVATAEGRIARVLYGIDYPARDLELALVEASAGRIGTPLHRALLFCYRYDPATGRYSFAVMNAVRAGGAATLAGLLAFMAVHVRRERRSRRPAGPQTP